MNCCSSGNGYLTMVFANPSRIRFTFCSGVGGLGSTLIGIDLSMRETRDARDDASGAMIERPAEYLGSDVIIERIDCAPSERRDATERDMTIIVALRKSGYCILQFKNHVYRHVI